MSVGNGYVTFQFNEAVRLVDVLLVSYYCNCSCIKVVLLPFDQTVLRRCLTMLSLVLIAGVDPRVCKAKGRTLLRSIPRPCCFDVLSV